MPKNRKLQNIIGTEHITDAAEAAIAAQASGGATVAFKNVAVAGQDNVVADAATDTLTLVGGSNVTITTDASADSVTITAASGGMGFAAVDDGVINSSYTRFALHQAPLWGRVGTGAGALSNQNDPVFRPFIAPHSGTISEFGVECTTADGADATKAKIAIYTDSNGAPHTKMGEIDIPVTSTGATFITSGLPTVTLVRDTQYWWGYCRNNQTNTIALRTASNGAIPWVGPSTSVGTGVNQQSVLVLSSSANTMPTTITQANLAPSYISPPMCTLKF